MIWITSDWHFGHEKDFILQPRGYESCVEAANDIIQKFNNLVSESDIVYVLGDCMLRDDNFGLFCIAQLNGIKYLAYGNHDTDSRIEKYIEAGFFEDIQMGYRLRQDKYQFWLSHYPMKMGNYKDKHPTWNLSGHTHQQNLIDGENCIYNVSLDAHYNNPISLDEIINDIKKYRQIHPTIPLENNGYYE